MKNQKCASEEKISMLVDGEIGKTEEKDLLEHIKVCDKCREIYEQFRNVARALDIYGKLSFNPRLMRRTNECLDDETMAAFLDDTLEKKEREKVLEHISRCNYCFDLVNSKYQYDEEFGKVPVNTGKRVPEAKREISLEAQAEKYLNEGINFFREEEYQRALRCAMKALEIKPQWGQALDLRANCEEEILKQKERIANEDRI